MEKHETVLSLMLACLRPLDLVYDLWRMNKALICPACGAKSFIPVNTRRGLRLVQPEKESFRSRCRRMWPLAFGIGIVAAIVWISLWRTGHK
jgi:hypothetical protein